MKARWRNEQWVVVFIAVTILFAPSDETHAGITPKKAIVLAEQEPEVQALYELNGGRFVECIEKYSQKTCDTDWVTCIEDAWVVSFVVGDLCGVVHDGRLNVTYLMDNQTGEIISRYPEAVYFEDPAYCMEDYECLEIPGQKEPCANFIHAQIRGNREDLAQGECVCRDNTCRVSEYH